MAEIYSGVGKMPVLWDSRLFVRSIFEFQAPFLLATLRTHLALDTSLSAATPRATSCRYVFARVKSWSARIAVLPDVAITAQHTIRDKAAVKSSLALTHHERDVVLLEVWDVISRG